MEQHSVLEGIECTSEIIKAFMTKLLVELWAPGDEYHNRNIHEIVKNKSYTNVIIYSDHISINTGKKIDMRPGEHEHNRKQAAGVMSSFRGCKITKEEDPEIYEEVRSVIGYNTEKYIFLSVYLPDIITELPKLNQITFNDILNAPVKDKATNKSEMLNYFEQRKGMDAPCEVYEYFNSGNGAISRVEVDNIFIDVDNNWKYGDMYHRIFWDGDLIGLIHRSGKYLDTYTYRTFDKEKWDEMSKSIETELNWGFDEPVEIISSTADLFNVVKIHGRDLEEYGEE